MNTNKLGLKIVSIQQGYNDLLEINGSAEWTSKVWDLRTDLTELGNLQKGSNVLFVTSIDTGTLLTVARPTDGRIGDCIAALVYVPFRLAITGQQLSQVIDFVSSGLGQVTLDRDVFQKEFSKTYDINPLDALFLTSEEKRDKAFRYYGKGTKYTLSEILGKLNQPEYRKYKSVVLLDKESNIVAKGTDLTDTPLANMLIMAPPTETCGFVPYIGGKPFIAPVFVGSTEKVQIVLKKAGYKDVSRTLAATEKLVLTPHDKMRPVEVGAIKVWDEATRRPVEGCRISINGQPLPAYVSDGDRNQASIKVEAPGYQTYRATVDLDRNNGIMLKKTTRAYVFQFRLKNGDDCRFSIETLNELVEVPFRGYESEAPIREKVVNYLEYKPATGGIKRTVIIALVALLLGCGLGWGLSMLFAGEPEKVTSEEVTSGGNQLGGGEDGGTDNGGNAAGGSNPTPPTGDATEGDTEDAEGASQKEIEAAIKYLDNPKWVKNDMEKIKLLEGFFEKVNTYKYDEVEKYKSKFEKSSNYMKILNILHEVKTKKVDVKEIYDKSTSTPRSITITSFIDDVKNRMKPVEKEKKEKKEKKENEESANSIVEAGNF